LEADLKRQHFLRVELAGQKSGAKPFDGMAAGEFTDMYGRKVKFKKEDLPAYVANTKAVLASTADASGAIVGLPIDGMNHDHQLAAGWVVDVELGAGGNVIEFTPRWTDWGMELIAGDVMRFFSPTVDLSNKTIMGGSLTNWPATRDEKTGKILLRPVELSAGLFEMTEESLIERANNIARAFRAAFRDQFETEDAWPVDVYEGYVICELGDKLYKVTFEEGEEGFEFAEFEDWVEVKRAYVEAMQAEQTHYMIGEFRSVSNGGDHAPDADLSVSGEKTMTVKLAELSAEDRAELVKQVAASLSTGATPPAAGAENAPDLISLFNLQGASDEVAAAVKQTLLEQYDLIKEKASREAAEMIASVRREADVSDLCARLTGGDKDAPFGLPVKSDDLKAWLLSLDKKQADFARELLTNVAKNGPIDYRERGHGKTQQGTQILPPMIAASLRSWIDAGQSVAEFFRVNAVELGNMSDYNLAEFQGKEK
jgi:hypothetical protein